MSETRMSGVLVEKAFTELNENTDKRTVISALAQSLADSGQIKSDDIEEIVEGAMAREAIGSTGIGHGIAIPHCRTPLVKQLVCAYGRAQKASISTVSMAKSYTLFSSC